jgi:hypothetical protein
MSESSPQGKQNTGETILTEVARSVGAVLGSAAGKIKKIARSSGGKLAPKRRTKRNPKSARRKKRPATPRKRTRRRSK